MGRGNETSEGGERRRGRILVFSGPSGVGKGTLLKRLFAETDFPLVSSVSATTRAPRPGEVDGVDYRFFSREEFLRRREAGEFLESFEVYAGGALYGTLREDVETALARGEWVVLEIDVKGAASVAAVYPDAETIFIEPPSIEALRERLKKRGSESDAEIEKRVAQAETELAASGFYRRRVVNDDLDDALAQIVGFLSER